MSDYGPVVRRVTVTGVGADGIALVRDSLGREFEVHWDLWRTPFKPVEGDLWLIDKLLGPWTFAARFGGTPPGSGGGIGAETDPVAMAALGAHGTALDPHSQYLTTSEGTAVATGVLSAHTLASDPHPGYITEAELASYVSGGTTASSYTHNQILSSDTWPVIHNLGFHPNVSVVDSAGSVVLGSVDYTGLNTMTLRFSAPFSGSAYLS